MATGRKTGGRRPGSKNKRTTAIEAAVKAAMKADNQTAATSPMPEFDTLEKMRWVAVLLLKTTEKALTDKVAAKELRELSVAAARVLSDMLPYTNRRLATLEPAMEATIKPDGSVHVTISRTDSEL